jgi:hypothetical protein
MYCIHSLKLKSLPEQWNFPNLLTSCPLFSRRVSMRPCPPIMPVRAHLLTSSYRAASRKKETLCHYFVHLKQTP